MDIVSFIFVAIVTATGGGTLRDLLLGVAPVFWIRSPDILYPVIATAIAMYFVAPYIQSRFKVLVWADAMGMALFTTTGAAIALEAGTSPFIAVIMGGMTATFGGLLRDVIMNEFPLLLRQELYLTPTFAGAAAMVYLPYVFEDINAGPINWAVLIGFLVAFVIRGIVIIFDLKFPRYKPRPGRQY